MLGEGSLSCTPLPYPTTIKKRKRTLFSPHEHVKTPKPVYEARRLFFIGEVFYYVFDPAIKDLTKIIDLECADSPALLHS